jgi:hypothetical protein
MIGRVAAGDDAADESALPTTDARAGRRTTRRPPEA